MLLTITISSKKEIGKNGTKGGRVRVKKGVAKGGNELIALR